MKTSILILAVVVLALIVALPLTITKKNKQISHLQYELSEKENEIQQLKSEKEELTTKISDLEEENSSLERKSEMATGYQSNVSPSYPIASATVPSVAGATVVYRRSGCDYFILESMKGYIVAEWMGGHDPDEGETLFGNFNSYGTKTYFNGTNTESRLWIEDYWLSKEDAFEKVNEECK
jgi:hypothetical protein